jgi:hypothetical protein
MTCSPRHKPYDAWSALPAATVTPGPLLLEPGTRGRKVTYALTDHGRDSLSRGVDALAQRQANLLGALTPAQLTGLQDGLAALRGRLIEIGQE